MGIPFQYLYIFQNIWKKSKFEKWNKKLSVKEDPEINYYLIAAKN